MLAVEGRTDRREAGRKDEIAVWSLIKTASNLWSRRDFWEGWRSIEVLGVRLCAYKELRSRKDFMAGSVASTGASTTSGVEVRSLNDEVFQLPEAVDVSDDVRNNSGVELRWVGLMRSNREKTAERIPLGSTPRPHDLKSMLAAHEAQVCLWGNASQASKESTSDVSLDYRSPLRTASGTRVVSNVNNVRSQQGHSMINLKTRKRNKYGRILSFFRTKNTS